MVGIFFPSGYTFLYSTSYVCDYIRLSTTISWYGQSVVLNILKLMYSRFAVVHSSPLYYPLLRYLPQPTGVFTPSISQLCSFWYFTLCSTLDGSFPHPVRLWVPTELPLLHSLPGRLLYQALIAALTDAFFFHAFHFYPLTYACFVWL